MERLAKLFGSAQRTRLLVAVALLKETYAREVASVLDLYPLTAQRILDDYEREGVLVSHNRGRARIFALNTRMSGASELRGFLTKYARRTDVPFRIFTIRHGRTEECGSEQRAK